MMNELEKRKRDGRFHPLRIADLDVEKSKLVTGSKTMYYFHLKLSEMAPREWVERFNEAYAHDRNFRAWKKAANCDGSHIVIACDERLVRKCKRFLGECMAKTNDEYGKEYAEKRQAQWDKENRQRLEQETLVSVRTRMFKRRYDEYDESERNGP